MAFKTFLTFHAIEQPVSKLNPLVELARTAEAHLDVIVLGVLNTPPVVIHDIAPAAEWANHNNNIIKDAEKCAEDIEQLVAKAGISASVTIECNYLSMLDNTVARYTLCADLYALTKDTLETDKSVSNAVSQSLFEAGCPFLLLPNKVHDYKSMSKIAIAWNGLPQAAKAVHRALPLLKSAESVNVIVVDPSESDVGEDTYLQSVSPPFKQTAHLKMLTSIVKFMGFRMLHNNLNLIDEAEVRNQMKLLLDRGQRSYWGISILPLRFGSGNIFTIKAQLELDPHELKLIDKYKLRDAAIVESSIWSDFKKAIPQAFLLALIVGILGITFGSLRDSPMFFAIAFIIMTIVYYKEEKERILVLDFIDKWRTFRCYTVVDLVHKEAALEGHFQYLQYLLITAKHWDDKGVVDIEPVEKTSAKLAVLKATQ